MRQIPITEMKNGSASDRASSLEQISATRRTHVATDFHLQWSICKSFLLLHKINLQLIDITPAPF